MELDSKYEEALERARKGMPIDEVFPELRESEDEEIRKALVNFFKNTHDWVNLKYDGSQIVAYLEKQKEQKSLNISAASEWLRKHVCRYMNSEYNEFHKSVEYDGSIDEERLINDFEGAMQKEQKPAEWSEEDERLLNIIIDILDKEEHNGHLMRNDLKACIKLLKSLHPQPSPQLSTNHTVWHNASEEKPTKLPIIHIWYHGNRVNAVTHEDTCLQAELDDINFQPDDKWAYVEDLLNVQPHWKPSEEQMKALKDVINRALLTCRQQVPLESLYNDLQKLL